MGRKVGKAKRSRQRRPAGGQRSVSGKAQAPGLRLWDMLTLSDQTDEYGRLLLEDSAPPSAIAKADRSGVPRHTVVCPYTDTPSRVSGWMNESAYEALRVDTADIFNGFAWLCRNYLGAETSVQSSVQTLFDVSHLGLTLPLVLFGKADAPVAPKGKLPSYVASLFKASRGVYSAAVDMLNKLGAERIVSPSDITEFADEHGHLRRPQTDRVCAAPTRLIQRTLAVILTGEGADAGKSGLGSLVEFPRLWDFYSLESRLSEALSEFGYVLNRVVSEAGPKEPQALFGYMVPLSEGFRTFGDITEDVLRRANEVQAGLNDILGRSRPASKIAFDDLLKLV